MNSLKHLEEQFDQGKITRREFLSRASMMGLMVALGPLAYSGEARSEVIPKKGGRFRLGMAGGAISDTLDTTILNDHAIMTLNWQLRNCLVEVNHKGAR